jgi:hypothetical protein
MENGSGEREEKGEWVRKKEKNQEKNERERERETQTEVWGKEKMFFLKFDADR